MLPGKGLQLVLAYSAAICAFCHPSFIGQAYRPALLATRTSPYLRCHHVRQFMLAHRAGGSFDRQRHASGTEVKAITYSAMQINEKPGDAEIFVIVDI